MSSHDDYEPRSQRPRDARPKYRGESNDDYGDARPRRSKHDDLDFSNPPRDSHRPRKGIPSDDDLDEEPRPRRSAPRSDPRKADDMDKYRVDPRNVGLDRKKSVRDGKLPRRQTQDFSSDDDDAPKPSSHRDKGRKLPDDSDDELGRSPRPRGGGGSDPERRRKSFADAAPRRNRDEFVPRSRPSHKDRDYEDDDEPPRRKDKERDSGRRRTDPRYDDEDDSDDDRRRAPPRRSRTTRDQFDDDRGYRSDHRPSKKYYDDGYRSDRGHARPEKSYERDRDRDRDRRDRNRDRDRDRDYRDRRDRDRDRDRYDNSRDRDKKKSKGAFGINTDDLGKYVGMGQKHYKTVKPIVESLAKMYMDNKGR